MCFIFHFDHDDDVGGHGDDNIHRHSPGKTIPAPTTAPLSSKPTAFASHGGDGRVHGYGRGQPVSEQGYTAYNGATNGYPQAAPKSAPLPSKPMAVANHGGAGHVHGYGRGQPVSQQDYTAYRGATNGYPQAAPKSAPLPLKPMAVANYGGDGHAHGYGRGQPVSEQGYTAYKGATNGYPQAAKDHTTQKEKRVTGQVYRGQNGATNDHDHPQAAKDHYTQYEGPRHAEDEETIKFPVRNKKTYQDTGYELGQVNTATETSRTELRRGAARERCYI